MDDRDALIKLLAPHLGGNLRPGTIGHMAAGWEAGKIADEILAAGWQAPRMSESDCEDQNGHEFYDTCAYCGADAHDYFNR